MTKQEQLIAEATKYIGTMEQGDNSGELVEQFQKAVDGKAQKESWCMAFVMFCLKKIGGHKLFESEHCMTVWNRTPVSQRLNKPEVGCVVIWQYWKGDKPTASGHTGIVTEIFADGFKSVEGNTGPGGAVVREGDGVYHKRRFFAGTNNMKIKGYLKAF